jgi:pilus assembly protein CpaF
MELHERLSTGRREQAIAPKEPFADLKNIVHMHVISSLGPQLFDQRLDEEELRDRVVAEIRARLSTETTISREDRERLTSEITDDIVGYGPTTP